MGMVYSLEPCAFIEKIAQLTLSAICIREQLVNVLHCYRLAFKLSLVYRTIGSSAYFTADLQVGWHDRQRKHFIRLHELRHQSLEHGTWAWIYTILVSYPTPAHGCFIYSPRVFHLFSYSFIGAQLSFLGNNKMVSIFLCCTCILDIIPPSFPRELMHSI